MDGHLAVSYVLAQPRLGGQACSFSLSDQQCWGGVTQFVNVAVKRFVISHMMHQHYHIARQGFKHCSASESCSFGCPGCLPCIQGAICGGEGQHVSWSAGSAGVKSDSHAEGVAVTPGEAQQPLCNPAPTQLTSATMRWLYPSWGCVPGWSASRGGHLVGAVLLVQ